MSAIVPLGQLDLPCCDCNVCHVAISIVLEKTLELKGKMSLVDLAERHSCVEEVEVEEDREDSSTVGYFHGGAPLLVERDRHGE